MPSFGVHISDHAERIVVTVVGELDFDTCPRITQVTDTVIIRDRTLCLDLTGVPFLDASGLGLLQILNEHAGGQGGLLELSGLQSQPRRVLELTGMRAQFRTTAGPGTADRSPSECHAAP
ncbi:STAS domain-containing protein [Streptomyces collinus]|uniref:STAS domain-containing protein n=1 Tax=Streptomyces collinus TaxID=42684 RepID=UPI002942B6AD|nr:STAS domain-containing protein [Streptomyces collinus]